MNPICFEGLKVVVFDVDGTLYRQSPLRRAMLGRLVRSFATRPAAGWRTLRALSAYRHAQETLRREACTNVSDAQIARACDRTGFDRSAVVDAVERWMEQEPLTLLSRFRHEGLVEFLEVCRAQKLKLAVFSDDPAAAKLRALGVDDFFDLVLCAQSPEIDVFKPHPRGIQVALRRLGVRPEECLYVGDRTDVDGAAADAAGVKFVAVTRSSSRLSDRYFVVSGYPELQVQLFAGAARLAVA